MTEALCNWELCKARLTAASAAESVLAGDGDAADLRHDNISTTANLVDAVERGIFVDEDLEIFAGHDDLVDHGTVNALRGVGDFPFHLLQLLLGRRKPGLPVFDFFVDMLGLFEVAGRSLDGELLLRRVQLGLGVTYLALKGLLLFREILEVAGRGNFPGMSEGGVATASADS